MDRKKGTFQRNLLDENFDLDSAYFFKDLSENKANSIRTYLNTFFKENKTTDDLQNFFKSLTVIKKGGQNLNKLRQIVEEVADENKSLPNVFESYRKLNKFINEEFSMPKPALLQALFFPNENNEDRVVNMLRTVRKTLDIAIFSITNDKIYAAIEEAWNDGVNVRIITDDECANQLGSDVYKLAAIV